MAKNMVVLVSSGGSVLDEALKVDACRQNIALVVCDRECAAEGVARRHGIAVEVLPCRTGREFSDALYDYFLGKPEVDLFLSSYSRLLSGKFLQQYRGRIVNFHPAVLPACPGLDGFGDTLKAGCKFIGATVHFVDEGMDTGKPILQAARPYDPELTDAENRQRVFLQMCRMFVQVVAWFAEGRVNPQGSVSGARYELSEFSPNLDHWVRLP
ncbi:phosphoribosylglycinamide formyltransferase-1 [Halomonas saccharevitans]|uniref:phosphoribosylglycinamide formyltransferase 1 n=2 Tax=Halomonas saccharevitans TaxID=416872 RepID=A0A1I7BDX7_9GAMM|nr:phosphoribosylglycinamide formyltransferase-1 [Halomonas saccharevitans]